MDFEGRLKVISESYDLYSRRIFILKLDPTKELLISYNIIPNGNTKFLPNTILTHRKKETNTLYTINALNKLIKHHNGGVLDRGYQIDWEFYKNCIILTDGDEFKVLRTKIFRIININ